MAQHLLLFFLLAGVISHGTDAYTAYNAHSIYGYKIGKDGALINTIGWDSNFPNLPLSWESVVECFPDWRKDFSVGFPDYDNTASLNYKNWNCDSVFGNDWKDGSKFPCGDDENTKVYYYLQDVEGTPRGPNGDGFISCYFKDVSYGPRRVLEFPEGYFAQSMQVWLPPLTKIVNPTASNPNDNDGKKANDGPQTFFIAKMWTSDAATDYASFDLKNADGVGSTITDSDAIDMRGYCNPPDNYVPDTWHDDAWSWNNVKKLRIGFLMHGSSDISNVNILGSDLVRPAENGYLCGGGSIETPGCISAYGSTDLTSDHTCYGAGSDTTPDTSNNFQSSTDWTNGGVIDWGKEYEAFGGISQIYVTNVRFNDPLSRYIDATDARYWPASQVSFVLSPTPDGSTPHHIYLNGLNSQTTIADGINIGGNAKDVTISNSYMSTTGDDAYAFWQGECNQDGMTLRDSRANNPGYRQGTQDYKGGHPYTWGSCLAFFGCHTAVVSNFICYDRTCPDTANPVLNSGDLESYSMCSDEGNGHMIVFHPHRWFNGKYDNWDDKSDIGGMCEVDVSNVSYLWMHDDSVVIDVNDPVDGGRNRDLIARSMNEEDWNGSLGPWVCWDGDDCRWAGQFETSSSSSVGSVKKTKKQKKGTGKQKKGRRST